LRLGVWSRTRGLANLYSAVVIAVIVAVIALILTQRVAGVATD
jgi:hypothetical protein